MKPEEIETLKNKLNLRQQKFCELYATTEEFYGNGTQSYIAAYRPDQSKPTWKNGVMVNANKLLSKTKILDYINAILAVGPLSDEFIDKQIGFLLTQNVDFGAKIAAAKEANQLKGRINKKITLTGDVNLKNLPDDNEFKEFLKWKAMNEKD